MIFSRNYFRFGWFFVHLANRRGLFQNTARSNFSPISRYVSKIGRHKRKRLFCHVLRSDRSNNPNNFKIKKTSSFMFNYATISYSWLFVNVRKYSQKIRNFSQISRIFCHLLASLNVHERSFECLIKVQDLDFHKSGQFCTDVYYVQNKQLKRLRNFSYVTY